ncbi:SagB family peptide dehydrogenase [Streptomyces sp. NPDC086010]|uniref:SagB family peptide dehydrogenase n=1 Tax=Streptomyces sp. NPDC086010 TaxID=3365745 RepID=UPI0037D8A54D
MPVPIHYRRNPWLLPEWSDDERLVVNDPRAERKFTVDSFLLRLLNRLSVPAPARELDHGGRSPDEFDALLQRLVDAGLLRAQATAGEGDDLLKDWSDGEIAMLARGAYAGRPDGPVETVPPQPLVHPESRGTVKLPVDCRRASRPLAEVLSDRRSVRTYGPEPLTLAELGTFLHRAARVRAYSGPAEWQMTTRPSPAGGGLHSLELYLIVRDVEGLEAGSYHYDPVAHVLERLTDWTGRLAAMQRELVCEPMRMTDPPQVSFYIASHHARTRKYYGPMALRLIHQNTGCLLQTLYLAAADLGLAPCATGLLEPEPGAEFLPEPKSAFVHTGNFALGR